MNFLQYAGIPVVNMWYQNHTIQHGAMYPLYHTLYETHFLNEKLMYPQVKFVISTIIYRETLRGRQAMNMNVLSENAVAKICANDVCLVRCGQTASDAV